MRCLRPIEPYPTKSPFNGRQLPEDGPDSSRRYPHPSDNGLPFPRRLRSFGGPTPYLLRRSRLDPGEAGLRNTTSVYGYRIRRGLRSNHRVMTTPWFPNFMPLFEFTRSRTTGPGPAENRALTARVTKLGARCRTMAEWAMLALERSRHLIGSGTIASQTHTLEQNRRIWDRWDRSNSRSEVIVQHARSQGAA